MDTKSEHVGRMEKNLKDWGKKIDELVEKAETAGAGVKADTKARIRDLKERHTAAQMKLDQLKSAGADKWETFKTDLDSAWSEFETAFKHLGK